MYKLLLCHRRDTKISSGKLRRHWREERSRMILNLQGQLGFVRYAQVYQLPRRNLLYRFIRFSRGWFVTTFLASKQGLPVSSPGDRKSQKEERWDVVEEFWYSNKQKLIEFFTSEAGKEAAERLADDQAPWVRRTAILVAEEFVVRPDPTNRSSRITTLFFLRTHVNRTRESMLEYWGDSHSQLVTSLHGALKYRAYDQMHVRGESEFQPGIDNLGGSEGEEFDGVASLAYGSQWELILGFFNPFTQIANLKLIKDEVGFIDAQRSSLVFGKQLFF